MAFKTFDYKFLAEPDDSLKCVICLEVAKNPKQHEDCGKLFCRECIEKNGNKPCPNCRADNPQYFCDAKSLREIKALHVRCDKVERGCKWKGTVGTLEDHVTKCGFTLVFCPNKCKVEGEDLQLMRKDMYNHLKIDCPNRYYKCKYCDEKGTYASITEKHDKICEKKIVPCPNTKCASEMERGKTSNHVQTDCDYTVVACRYSSIGCCVKGMRKDMKQREEDDDKTHPHLSIEKIEELENTASSSKNEIISLKSVITSLKNEFTTSKDSLTNQITALKTSLLGDISSLQDTTSSLKENVDTLQKENSISFKLTEYSKKKESNAEYLSQPFFTSHGGYKMCFEIDANGYGKGKGTHVSVYSKLLEGPYNNQLCWPFTGTVTHELLNQLADDNHHSIDVQYDDIEYARPGCAWGREQFIPHSELSHDPARNTQYLMDDTLYFRVTVKVDNHKPWLDCTHHI